MRHQQLKWLEIQIPQINEGENATYTLRIAPAGENKTTSSDQDIEVALELSDSGGDYIDDENTSISATISAGDSSEPVVVSTIENYVAEAHGSITVSIQADDGETSDGRYLVSDNYDSVTTNVNDNDISGETALLKFVDARMEVDEDSDDGYIELEVELEGSPSADITVTFATEIISGGLSFATEEDYNAPAVGANTVTFTYSADDPELTKTIQIPITNDLIDELDETFKLVLRNPVGAPLSNDAGESEMIITINDDDAPPVIQVSSASNASVVEGDTATFTYSIVTDSDNTTTESTRDIAIQVLLSEENGYYLGNNTRRTKSSCSSNA